MKKKIISTVLSMLSIISIVVCVPFYAFADDYDLGQNVIDAVCEEFVLRIIDKDKLTAPVNDTASQLVRKLQEQLIDGQKIPNYYILDGNTILNYEIGENKYQCLIHGKLYYSSDGIRHSIENDDGSVFSSNVLYIDITYSDGYIYHYRLIPDGSLTISKNTTYTRAYLSGVKIINPVDGVILGTDYTCSWDFVFDNGAKIYKTLSDFDSRFGTGSYQYLDGFLPSTSASTTTKQSYPYSLYLAVGKVYTLSHGGGVTNATRSVSINSLCCSYMESNDSTVNGYISNQPYSPTYNYYNNYFQGGATYNSSTTNIDNIIDNSEKDRTLKLPTLPELNLPDINLPDYNLPDLPSSPNLPDVSGGWVSPDYPAITGTAVLNPAIVEFSTADIPSNLMNVGTSFLSESLNVVDVIPNYMLCLGIIFMVWVCFHIFGK